MVYCCDILKKYKNKIAINYNYCVKIRLLYFQYISLNNKWLEIFVNSFSEYSISNINAFSLFYDFISCNKCYNNMVIQKVKCKMQKR